MTLLWIRHQLYLQRISPKLLVKRNDAVEQGKAEEELRNNKNCPISLSFLGQRSLGQERGREGEDVSPERKVIFVYLYESNSTRLDVCKLY